MSKIALLCYHKNAEKIYPAEWIEQYRDSVLKQTYKEFDIVECNYGGDYYRIFEGSNFDNIPSDNFVQTLNRLLDKCFFELGYDFVFNSNVDDFFATNRIEKQLPFLKNGFDIVSSNFCLLQDDKIIKNHQFHKLDVVQELLRNHNVICHPSVAYSRKFWEYNKYIPQQMPTEDLKLWQRAIQNSKFIILPDNLLYHRLHSESVCQSNNK